MSGLPIAADSSDEHVRRLGEIFEALDNGVEHLSRNFPLLFQYAKVKRVSNGHGRCYRDHTGRIIYTNIAGTRSGREYLDFARPEFLHDQGKVIFLIERLTLVMPDNEHLECLANILRQRLQIDAVVEYHQCTWAGRESTLPFLVIGKVHDTIPEKMAKLAAMASYDDFGPAANALYGLKQAVLEHVATEIVRSSSGATPSDLNRTMKERMEQWQDPHLTFLELQKAVRAVLEERQREFLADFRDAGRPVAKRLRIQRRKWRMRARPAPCPNS